MSTSRVPRPRTTSATPSRKPTASTSSGTPASPRPTATAGRLSTGPALKTKTSTPSLKTKTSAPKLRVPAGATRPKTPVSPSRDTKPPSPASPSSKALSIKEQIALRRAEQLKQVKTGKPTSFDASEDGSVLGSVKATEEDILGRLSIRDTVDRAKSSGTVILASRELTRIPSYLFQSHLSLTPQPLKDSPPEVIEPEQPSKVKKSGKTTWYEQVDLTSLKVWDNEILEIQPEISLFGSLKILDLHKNKLKTLPTSLFDLVFLTNLDVSENELEELPDALASLPSLSSLNISHNKLTTIPFEMHNAASSKSRNDSFFAPTIERATTTLPNLKILHASHNLLRADKIQLSHTPQGLTEIDLSHNELGQLSPLLSKLSTLSYLRIIRLHSCGLTDVSLSTKAGPFTALQLLDLGENDDLSEDAISQWMGEREIEITASETKRGGALNVVLGKPGPEKEAWEIEAENRTRLRKGSATPDSVFSIGSSGPPPIKSPKRPVVPVTPVHKEEPVKESWEIEAEQGLLTEGGKRRARAAAAAASTSKTNANSSATAARSVSPVDISALSVSGGNGSVSFVQFYDGPHATLKLPPSLPQSRTHNRSFSVISPTASASASDLVVPLPTLPLPIILSQSFANNVKILILSNRRTESSIILPSSGTSNPVMPHLDELLLDNCNLPSMVPTSMDMSSSSTNKESLFDTIANLFPSLSTLDLSYNALTTLASVNALLIPDAEKKRKGLTTLRLRGNRLSSLDPLEELATAWKNGGGVEGWRGEELDLRDNEVGRLPPLLGLLPLDVLLVEGNTFRVPARRVWEKDGTKGLLKWLADRI